MIRFGDIEFLNSWPVTYGLRAGEIACDWVVVSGTPAELNRKLLTGELDAGAVSSVAFLRHLEEFVPIPGLCIRSDKGIGSVLVVSREPLHRLKKKEIGVSNQGATTPVLLKLLLRRQHLKGILKDTSTRYPQILQEYPAALLIGDEALAASSNPDLIRWDLGQAWEEWTRLPFVYALWVIRRRLAETQPHVVKEVAQVLWNSFQWANSHPKELVGAMRKVFPWEVNFLKAYLSKVSYVQDERAWKGLRRFAKEAEQVGELAPGTTAKSFLRFGKGEVLVASVR